MTEEKTTDIFYEIRKISDFRDLLSQCKDRFAGNPAFKYLENDTVRQITFSELYDRVNSLGTALCALGLKNEKIAVIGENSWKWCCAYFSVTNGTGVVVPMDRDLMPPDILNILSFAECKAVFFDEKSREKLNEIKDRLPADMIYISFSEPAHGELDFDDLIRIGGEKLKNGFNDFVSAEIDPMALGSLIFTSGTTGEPKGVMLSQYNICSDIMALSGVVKITSEDSVLSVLPLHHTYECSLSFLMLLYSGGCLCFCRGLRYIQKDMLIFEPTLFVTVPLMLEK
ncbi:MAG: AMP-binding protein, partial [Clostridiales bacterium]|nr:AMP-binding protein [Clostridiales bacterium]